MKTVPFYANTDDNTHCFQASMRMILKYFLPEREFTWSELEVMSAKVEGLSTWPQQMLINLSKMGFDTVIVEGFDGPAFIREGREYLKRAFDEETAAWQIKNSDLQQEQRLYKELLAQKDVRVENRVPALDEMRQLLTDGYLINSIVNSRRLNAVKGYSGHSIVIYDLSEKEVAFHDPGLPSQQSRHVSIVDFEAAWADPNETAKNFIAIKLKES